MNDKIPAETVIKNGIEIGAPAPARPTPPPSGTTEIKGGLNIGNPTPKKK